MQYISLLDYIVLPFVLAFVYIIAYNFRNRRYPRNHPWRKYFIPALTVKLFGAVFIGLIYAYYYKGGDTFSFYNHAKIINSAFDESLIKWFNLLLHIPSYYDGAYHDYISQMEWYSDPASYTVASIAAFLSIFTLNTFLPTAVLFAAFSFTGIWALFRTFASIYPHLIRPIAVAILFIPSVFIWGSGIFKDTICIFALGWLTYSTFRFLVKKDFRFSNIVLAIFCSVLIATVKLYIILAFAPALLMWILFNYSQKIKNLPFKLLVKAFFISVVIAGFLFFMQRFAKELGSYSLDRMASTAKFTGGYIYSASGEEGSSYSLGEFEPNIANMVTKFPLAVNVTFFRPYLWEAKKLIVGLSAIEAFIFLFLTLKILFTISPARIWRTISQDPTIQFCLVFSIIFAFAVGISSYNFGALSRYKIPCLPFYALALILIHYKNKPASKKFFGLVGV
jgi:hypothetical protein